ncbi:hypothetical protein DENSPDRAFT_787000 [Dentipellis sp. KUC8613]|nr:hypothetical protein DENSPDRAFT_787000 [Dentipellis sp. KUC8613]
MTDLSDWRVTKFASGEQNLKFVNAIPAGSRNDVEPTSSASEEYYTLASSPTLLQLFYPSGSINPAGRPQGGSDFYASPIDVSNAFSVTLQYDVFFPADFDWVLGGKLPGLYGGHDACSGGDDALNCFSTRLMWRPNGAGEMYLYAPKNKQTRTTCSLPPQSVCESSYGLSLARGSFHFKPGAWTHVKQTITLNTPGQQDGGLYLEVNGKAVISQKDIYYRGNNTPPPSSNTPTDGSPADDDPTSPDDDDDDGDLLSPILGGLLGNATIFDIGQSEGLASIIGFSGIFFSTFFGGHDPQYATPKDQYTWFKGFTLKINKSN